MYAPPPAGGPGRTPHPNGRRGNGGGGGQPPPQRPRLAAPTVIESSDSSGDELAEPQLGVPSGAGLTTPGRPAGPAPGPVCSARRGGPVASPGTPATAPAGTYDVVSVGAATLEGNALLFRVEWVGGAVTWEPITSFISGDGSVTCALTTFLAARVATPALAP